MIARGETIAKENAILHWGITFAQFVLCNRGLKVDATAEGDKTGVPMRTVSSMPWGGTRNVQCNIFMVAVTVCGPGPKTSGETRFDQKGSGPRQDVPVRSFNQPVCWWHSGLTEVSYYFQVATCLDQ